ncbi:MAG: DUF2007 domain-containing protein [Candidatus Omnitrophota bacterium]
MATFIIYLLLIGTIFYFIYRQGKPFSSQTGGALSNGSKNKGLRSKRDPREIWKQVYETSSMEEARLIRARLEEEDIECILYEQGKKDIHGNLLKGVGVAVPSAEASRAQASIAKMPV